SDGPLYRASLSGAWGWGGGGASRAPAGAGAPALLYGSNPSGAGSGAAAAPPLLGLLAAKQGWDAVFRAVAATYALCAVSWLLIDSTIPLLAESPAEPIP